MITLAEVRKLALSLPAATERPAYGMPCFRVRDKIFTSMPAEGWIAVKTTYGERAALVAGNPAAFSVTQHYRNYPMVVVTLAAVDPDELRELVIEAWRLTAPKRLVAAFDGRSEASR